MAGMSWIINSDLAIHRRRAKHGVSVCCYRTTELWNFTTVECMMSLL